MSQDSLLLYGAKLDSSKLVRALEHIFDTNHRTQERGQRGTPVCIWGMHGLGKTTVVQELAQKKNWKLAYCAPAQFEEMGDLHGLPQVVDPDPNVEGDEYTVFRPPEWVPTEEGPGILLLDDMNRADDRILRGLMQLLQKFEMFSWALPPKWQIVATANPEGGDYSVTPLDDAMLTRLLHVTLVWDVKAWAAWASRAGVDERGIAFLLTYPEVMTGKRTTPRSVTSFFEQISSIEDLKKDADLVRILAESALDDITVATFMSFVMDGLEQLIDPEEILETDKWSAVSARIKQLAEGEGEEKRVDRLSTICTRLYLRLIHPDYKPGENDSKNLVNFLLHKSLPNDLRVSLHRDLLKDGSEEVRAMMRDKKLAELMLEGM